MSQQNIEYCMATYSDHRSFATVMLARTGNKIQVVDEIHNPKNTSLKEIGESIKIFNKKYDVMEVTINPLPTLEKHLKNIVSPITRGDYTFVFSIRQLELDIENGIFAISALLNDDNFSISAELRESLRDEFDFDDVEKISHRVRAIILALTDFRHGYGSWYYSRGTVQYCHTTYADPNSYSRAIDLNDGTWYRSNYGWMKGK